MYVSPILCHQKHCVHQASCKKNWHRYRYTCVLPGPNGGKEKLYNSICPYCKNQKSASEAPSVIIPGENRVEEDPNVVQNNMKTEQQMQVRELCEQQGIKLTTKQTSAEARIAVLEPQLNISSQPKKGDVKNKEEETPKKLAWGRNRGNPMVIHQAFVSKCKEPS